MPKKSKSSRNWLKEHFSDPFVKKAQKAGFRSRAVYKLQEIDERDKLFFPGMTIVDLGAAPGGWSEYIIKRVGAKGRVLALDILPMKPIPQVEFIQGDFTAEPVLETLSSLLAGIKIDWILSDMAPNLSGIESVDQPRSIYLAELAFSFAVKLSEGRAGVLVKVFQGEGFDSFIAQIKQYYTKVAIRKPEASRGRSREVYILARNK